MDTVVKPRYDTEGVFQSRNKTGMTLAMFTVSKSKNTHKFRLMGITRYNNFYYRVLGNTTI